MRIESQREQNPEAEKEQNPETDFRIQADLILEFGGRSKAEEWIIKYSEQFREIIEKNPELVKGYPGTKETIKKLLYGETIN